MFPSTDATDTNYWTQQNVTVTESGTSPSGKAAYKVLETATTGSHRITDLVTVNDDRYYCISVDVKPIGGRNFNIYTGSAFGSISFVFDLSDGSLEVETHGTKTSGIATELTDGWWNVKVYAEATSNGSTTIGLRVVDGASTSYLGDTAKGVYVSSPRS